MFKVLKIDGPNITTDRGSICLSPFVYADGGKSTPVSQDDFCKMRDLFVALPELVEALYAAQTALYDAMHAGHLDRSYCDNVADKIDAAFYKGRIKHGELS